MRIGSILLSLSTTALLACAGVGSSGYRDSSGEYARIAYTPHGLDDGAELFAGEAQLELDALIAAVLERNPSIELARQGWRAALAQYPQATSFGDPMIGVSVAPLSFIDPDVKIGVGAEVSQPLPYPGKRRLRGDVVLAEADAAREDYLAARQRLALMAAQLYWDYYLAERALEINAEHTALLTEYGQTVENFLVTGKAGQDDAFEVDIDLAQLQRQRTALESDRDVTVAQLDALLHRHQRAPLPAPAAEVALPVALSASREALHERALAQRPELRAVGLRQRGALAAISLAERDYYPDLRLTGAYNRMWPMVSHQFMVGLAIELPVTRGRRDAGVEVARARSAQRRADHARISDEVRRDVETSFRRSAEADEVGVLYRDRVLPATEGRIQAVRIGLDAGRTTFLEVIRAERVLRVARLEYVAAIADAHRRRAELDWAIGRLPGSGGSK
jgi:outer membrane protein TolC